MNDEQDLSDEIEALKAPIDGFPSWSLRDRYLAAGEQPMERQYLRMQKGDPPTMSDLADYAQAIELMTEDQGKAALVTRLHDEALAEIARIAEEFPGAAGRLLRASMILLLADMNAISGNVGKKLKLDERRAKPLREQSAGKAAAFARAQAIATELWKADTAQDIRIGDMAEQVYRALVAEGFAESLPGTAERIREWIKSVAPDYASKGGRRCKTP